MLMASLLFDALAALGCLVSFLALGVLVMAVWAVRSKVGQAAVARLFNITPP